MAELARRRGDRQPRAYHQWVLRLVQENSISEAIEAAREGVESIQEEWERAKLADYLGQLAEDTEDIDLALESRRKAFQFGPCLRRLVACWSLCKEGGEDVDHFMKELLHQFNSAKDRPHNRLSAMLELTAGEYASAVRRCTEAEPLGWSNRGHPGYVVFPFLLLAGTGCKEAPAPSCMEQMLNDLDNLRPSFLPPQYLYPDLRDPLSDTSYTDLVRDALSRHPIEEQDRPEYLNAARSIAWKRMEAIVSNKHRKAYERAARILLATAEAISLRKNPDIGLNLPREAREEFPRHSAFRRELNQLLAYSSVLPNVQV